MSTRLRVALPRAALAVMAAVTGGCANGRVSDQDSARATVETFLAQCSADRGVRVLETLNPSARTVLLEAGGTRAGCNAVLKRAGRPLTADQLRVATPRLTAFDGTIAEFAVTAPGGGPARVTVSRGAEGWQIEGPS
jgi:hypothetical protein